MLKRISIAQFRTEAEKHDEFQLIHSEPLDTLRIFAKFKKVTVNISRSPYVILQSDSNEVCLKHIAFIQKDSAKNTCSYTFTCNDFSVSDTPTAIDYRIECI